MTPILQIRNLHVRFGDVHAVNGIDLDINAGESVGLVGESGSGKSVTALSLLRLLAPTRALYDHGEIIFGGKDILKMTRAELTYMRGNQIAMIFQEPMSALNPLHSVEKQIGEILEVHRIKSGDAMRAEIIRLLTRVGIETPETRLNAFPHELSGGQRQRVMIAMALANRPQLLIADEPTTALDVTIQKQILELLRDIQSEYNMALLLITHDLGMVRHMTRRVAVMHQGKIVEQASTADIFTKPTHPYTRALISATPKGTPVSISDDAPILVEANHMRVWFPIRHGVLRRVKNYIRAVDDISFSIRKGETLGIVGESGSGKTSVARAWLRLVASNGDLRFAGAALPHGGARLRRLRRDMQFVFQDPYGALSPRFSVREIIAEGLRVHEPHLSATARDVQVRTALADVEMDPDAAERYPHEFSGGQRQRIAIARALILRPQFVVFDEPTSALDRSVQMQIIALLRRLQVERQLTYMFISHDLATIRAMSHQILVMRHGITVEAGTTQAIFESPQTDYTRALLDAAFY